MLVLIGCVYGNLKELNRYLLKRGGKTGRHKKTAFGGFKLSDLSVVKGAFLILLE